MGYFDHCLAVSHGHAAATFGVYCLAHFMNIGRGEPHGFDAACHCDDPEIIVWHPRKTLAEWLERALPVVLARSPRGPWE